MMKGYVRYYDLTLMFLPVIAYFLLFKYGPMYGLVLAFKDFKIKAGILGSPWVGLINFANLFEAATFVRAVKNTVIISLLKLACGFPMPIILALMLNELRGVRFKKVVQTISYLPHFLSWVVLSGLFTQFLSPGNGAINYIIRSFGGDPIYFLADNAWFSFTLIITEIWKGAGWGSILYIATIAGINPEIYEAAECDGSGHFARMWYITLPEEKLKEYGYGVELENVYIENAQYSELISLMLTSSDAPDIFEPKTMALLTQFYDQGVIAKWNRAFFEANAPATTEFINAAGRRASLKILLIFGDSLPISTAIWSACQ
ncbi:MAG: ABC transporter permease subunit [Christensenellales bacterium]